MTRLPKKSGDEPYWMANARERQEKEPLDVHGFPCTGASIV
jgi:hypothetical protein